MTQATDESNYNPTDLAIFLILSGTLIGILLRWTLQRIKIRSLPYSVLLLIIGTTIGGFSILIGKDKLGIVGQTIIVIETLDPHLILTIFIPALIFVSAFSVNYHIFMREFSQAFVLAVPAVLLNVFLVSILCRYIWQYNWDQPTSLLFGSIVSATDPVAVVATLLNIGASKRLATLIEAESLLNDGSAFVLYEILSELIKNRNSKASTMTLLAFRLAFIGPFFGIAVGLFISFQLNHVFNDALIETGITFVGAYFVFFVSEFKRVHISGVLAVVFLGLTVARFRSTISPKTEQRLNHVQHMIEYVFLTLIFLITGIIVADSMFGKDNDIQQLDLAQLIVLYIGVHVTRGITLLIFYPLLCKLGYGMTLKELVILWYGALRGAIGLALALITDANQFILKRNRDVILFHVSGLVLLTLLFNGMTIKFIVFQLDIDTGKPHSDVLLRNALNHLKEESNKVVRILSSNDHFSGANQSQIRENLPDYSNLLSFDKKGQGDAQQVSTDSTLPKTQNIDLPPEFDARSDSQIYAENNAIDIRHRFIASMRSFYWQQHEEGMTSRHALDILNEAAEEALDYDDLQKHWDLIKIQLRVPIQLKFMHRFNQLDQITHRMLYARLSLAVEILTAFIFASDRMGIIVKAFPEQGCYKEMEEISEEVRRIENDAKDSQTLIRKSYSAVYQAIQTKHAAAFILNRDKKNVMMLLRDGVLEKTECHQMLDTIEKHVHALTSKTPKSTSNETILENLPFLQHLPKKNRYKCLSKLPHYLLSEEENIYVQGNKPLGFSVILSGLAQLLVDGKPTTTVGPGCVIGAQAVLARKPYPMTSKALTPLAYVEFDSDLVQQIIQNASAEKELFKSAGSLLMNSLFREQFLGHGIDNGDMCYSSSFLHLNGNQFLSERALLLTGQAYDEANNCCLISPCVIEPLNFIIETNESGAMYGFTDAKILLFDGNDETQLDSQGGEGVYKVPSPIERKLSSQMSIGLIYVGGGNRSGFSSGGGGGFGLRRQKSSFFGSMALGNMYIPELIRKASTTQASVREMSGMYRQQSQLGIPGQRSPIIMPSPTLQKVQNNFHNQSYANFDREKNISPRRFTTSQLTRQHQTAFSHSTASIPLIENIDLAEAPSSNSQPKQANSRFRSHTIASDQTTATTTNITTTTIATNIGTGTRTNLANQPRTAPPTLTEKNTIKEIKFKSKTPIFKKDKTS